MEVPRVEDTRTRDALLVLLALAVFTLSWPCADVVALALPVVGGLVIVGLVITGFGAFFTLDDPSGSGLVEGRSGTGMRLFCDASFDAVVGCFCCFALLAFSPDPSFSARCSLPATDSLVGRCLQAVGCSSRC